MTETMARTRVDRRRRTAPAYFVAGLAWLALAALVLQHLEDLPRATLTVRNDTAWDLSLAVRQGDSTRPIATIGAGDERVVREVIVPGATWQLVWRLAGVDVGTSAVTDADVQRAGFVVRVPDDAARALRASGTPPAP